MVNDSGGPGTASVTRLLTQCSHTMTQSRVLGVVSGGLYCATVYLYTVLRRVMIDQH